MALIECPECGRKVSEQATTCPQCAHPLAQASGTHLAVGHGPVQTIEQTGKKWKAIQLLGAVLLLGGFGGIMIAAASAESGDGAALGVLSTLAVAAGIGLYIWARVMTWWHHR